MGVQNVPTKHQNLEQLGAQEFWFCLSASRLVNAPQNYLVPAGDLLKRDTAALKRGMGAAGDFSVIAEAQHGHITSGCTQVQWWQCYCSACYCLVGMREVLLCVDLSAEKL